MYSDKKLNGNVMYFFSGYLSVPLRNRTEIFMLELMKIKNNR